VTTNVHAADTHDLIRVHGARVNNLNNVDIEFPKRRLTVFGRIVFEGTPAQLVKKQSTLTGKHLAEYVS